jgi:hypothetical protein
MIVLRENQWRANPDPRRKPFGAQVRGARILVVLGAQTGGVSFCRKRPK